MIRYSDQAKIVLKKLDLSDEEICDLENWVVENLFIIGDGDINQWIISTYNNEK